MNYKIINLEQGSDEWLEFRKDKISASIVPFLLKAKGAYNPFLEANDFTKEKMKNGLELENSIRAIAEFKYFTDIKPMVIQSIDEPLFMASLDGIDESGVIYEFKYSNSEYNQILEFQKPSEKYYFQVQFQLFVSGAKYAIFGAMNESGEYVDCKVLLDESFAKHQVPKLKELAPNIEKIAESERKKAKKDDYKELEIEKARNLALEIIRLEETIKPIKEKLELTKKEFIDLANGEKISCLGVKVYPQTRTSIDYKGFLEFKKLEIPQEYKKQSVSWCVKGA
ncbi:YqaJ viral recombinase family protein [Campylobacter sp. CCS1377]|uniref:YqaJ viral recombinase family protein n=1 Tax=Campylobacter sp. CCS1377 TaxID=3158229 RepID=A0AAU7E4L9_9BACT